MLADRVWRPRIPLHVEEGLLVNDHAAWVWTVVPLVTHPAIERTAVLGEVQRHIRLLNRAQRGSWHLSVLPMPLSPRLSSVPLREVREQPFWCHYLDRQGAYLAQTETRSRIVLMGRKLGDRRDSGWTSARRAAERLVGAEGTVETGELERWRRQRDRWLGECRSQVPNVVACPAGVLRWTVWRAYWRGQELSVPSPPLDDLPTAGDEARSLINGVVRRAPAGRGAGYVRLGDRGEVYCSFLTLPHFPHGKTFETGFEWLFEHEKLPFPVEAQVRFEVLPTPAAKKLVANAERDAKAQQAHVREARQQPPDELDETILVARLERDRLEKEQGCHLRMWPRFCVWATSERELEERRQDLIGRLSDLDLRVEPARGDQLALWKEAMPGDEVTVGWHGHTVPPETLCGSMYLGSNGLGDPVGAYIGVALGSTTGADSRIAVGKQPVFEDQFLPANAGLTVSRKCAQLWTGDTGMGKSIDAWEILIQLAQRGGTCVGIDPKRDMDGLEDLGLDNFQRLLLDEHHVGLLNPFGLLHSSRERQGVLAAEVLQRMINPQLLDRAGYLIENAAMAEAREVRPRMSNVAARILAIPNPLASEIAGNLEAVRGMPEGQLLFADPPRDTAIEIEGRLTLVQFSGLQLPDRDITRPSLRQRLSLGLMTALTAFLGELMEFGADWIPKALLIDEAHLVVDSELETVITNFERMGRSKFAIVMIATQLLRDVVDRKMMSQIGVVRAYGSQDPGEFEAAARVFPGLTPQLAREWISGLMPRQCLMRDRQNRVNRLLRDIPFPELLRLLDTSPEGKWRRAHRAEAPPTAAQEAGAAGVAR